MGYAFQVYKRRYTAHTHTRYTQHMLMFGSGALFGAVQDLGVLLSTPDLVYSPGMVRFFVVCGDLNGSLRDVQVLLANQHLQTRSIRNAVDAVEFLGHSHVVLEGV